jgi:hypothetical protein
MELERIITSWLHVMQLATTSKFSESDSTTNQENLSDFRITTHYDCQPASYDK